MSKFSSAPAVTIWAAALLAILTPPQVAAGGFNALLAAQEQVFALLVEEPIVLADVTPKSAPSARGSHLS